MASYLLYISIVPISTTVSQGYSLCLFLVIDNVIAE